MLALALALGPACGGGEGDGGGGDDFVDPGPPPSESPIEPVWEPYATAARVKSPGQRMRFTAGLPFRILADGNDPNAYQCPPGSPPYVCADSEMQFYVDGVLVGTDKPDPQNQNLWELRLPRGLPAGNHVITVKFKPHAAPAIDGLVPVYIAVDPMPSRGRTINLTSDVVLSGSEDLDWTNAVVIGNGRTVRSAAGYSGRVLIRDAFVTGLAGFDDKIGIDVTTTGAVEITDSIFEATAPIQLVVNGAAPISITGNELRSTNYVTYSSSDPTRSPILDLSGSTTGAKVMQGNRIGAGIVLITRMADWQIGGLRDRDSNLLMGPRCVLQLDDSPGATIQGNYLRHDYHGGFSQGFNLMLSGARGAALAEHNVIRDGSWPLQSFGGELRYNLLVNSGHDFIRGGRTGARFHHNVFVHAQAPNSGYDGAVLMYDGERDIVFDNNTFDGGGEVASYDAPIFVLAASSVAFSSLRSNLFAHFSDAGNRWASRALISGDDREGSLSAARIAVADHNAWHNPLASRSARYTPGIVAGTAGARDVVGDPKLAGTAPRSPYPIDEGLLWEGKFGVSQVLAYFRGQYTPAAGSPLIDAGAGGAGNDIGAIGAGAAHPDDKFGKVMTP